ncbi:Arachidonate 12-lipoxygenase, 12S-type [Sciurus carolinensis]|uniref:Arachidonate 12-lipoxygenase, 12S-type n=1 Tax=Sciurus carolinensis TaxID=30640 RepID=A0AA41NJR9_SCICA|nr:Arachidonate 12-lipoxygenase, 12S-type [Sciurus carolinensis]
MLHPQFKALLAAHCRPLLARAEVGRVTDPWGRSQKCWQECQFLNGANPMLLRHSTSLPSRLVLSPGMEELGAQLEKELRNGSLFEADFIVLGGIPSSVIQGEKQYLAAPLVMLKMEPNGKLLPMVIQTRYMEGIVHLFYHRDDVVRGDPELQAWCREIMEVGLCQAQDRGKIHLRDRSFLETLPEPLPRSSPLGQNFLLHLSLQT